MLRKTVHIVNFIGLYLLQMLRSNILMARITIARKPNIKSNFIKVPVSLKSDFGLLLFSNLVSMTPGSLVTDINETKTTATIHVLLFTDQNRIIDEIEKMHNRIKQITG